MRAISLTIALLTLSNVFMTFAWYAHLKELSAKPWFVAALVSWGIAFFEYMLQVPANRIGYTALSLGQLKILQEVITLSVFVPFAVYYMKEPLKLDYLWAVSGQTTPLYLSVGEYGFHRIVGEACLPLAWRELDRPTRWMHADALQHIDQVGVRVHAL